MSYFDDASLVLIPSGYKDQKLYAVKPLDGAGDLAFSRASNATRVASNGLIEKVRTNLILQSEAFNTTWLVNAAPTITANTTIAPDGTTTGDTIAATAGSSGVYQIPVVSIGTEYSFSVYVKNITSATNILIGCDSGPSTGFVNFNAATGVITSVAGSITGSSVTNAGNGWYRVSGTYVATAALNTFVIFGASAMTFAAWGAQFETGVTTDYIATTSAAVSVGPVSGLPRLDYLNSTCPRLLLEPQRTNLALNSESVASDTNVGYSVTANNAASPDGYVNADRILEDTGTLHLIQKEFTVGSTTDSYAVSFFVKANGRTSGRILYGLGGAPFSAISATFNLTAGTITAPDASGGATAGSSKIENYGNGWYRVSLSGVVGIAGSHYVRIQDANGGAAGDPTKGFYVYGFQAELGAYVTSYIPTLGTSVTRVADAASKTGISSLIGQTEGVIFIDFVYTNLDSNGLIPITIGTDSSNHAYLYIEGTERITFDFIVAGTATGRIRTAEGYAVKGTRYKFAFAYKANDFAAYINGQLIGTDNSGAITALSNFYFGYPYAAGYSTPNTINQTLLFKTRLTNAQLAELTTL
jgi:hypothetical protein